MIRKIIYSTFVTLFTVLVISFASFGYDMQEKICDVLVLLEIFDDANNMHKQVTRQEFAKMIIKASKDKDISTEIFTSVCADVDSANPYAFYIKKALNSGYMITYLGGNFKPYDMVTYSDAARASLALLGYEDKDFANNKVTARNIKFESMELDDGIDKTSGHILNKKDIANILYNTLKENPKGGNKSYGLTIFDKLYKDEDGEFNTLGLVRTKLDGPYIAKKGKNSSDIVIPFNYEFADIYINGIKVEANDLQEDLDNYGYLIYYFDKEKKIVQAYSERADAMATIAAKKGYIGEINYSANSMLTPLSIDVEETRYDIVSEDMRIAFSYSGKIKKNDHILFIYNKYNDKYKTNDMREDIGRTTLGSIIYAIKYDIPY